MRLSRPLSLAAAAALVLGLSACAQSATAPSTAGGAAEGAAFPVSLKNAYGTTTIESQPKRVASVGWANEEVPLALGIVPVGMTKASWGDDDGDGVLPWTEARLQQLGAKTPVLFDDTDGIDFEAVADTRPDVILAAYSGLSQAEYDTLSKIAPVVSFPGTAWNTSLDDTIGLDSTAIGEKAEGEALSRTLGSQIDRIAADNPSIDGTTAFMGYIDANDLSKVGFYLADDPRAQFLQRLGMAVPAAVAKASEGSKEFYAEISAEAAARQLSDVDVIVLYGDDSVLKAAQADPLLSKIPAIRNGAVVVLPDSTPIAAAANPTPLSIPYNLADYVALLGAAADKA